MTSNSSDILICFDAESSNWIRFLINGASTTFFLGFGLIGSIVSWKHLREKSTDNVIVPYLLFLHCWDTIFLVSAFGFYGIASLLTGGTKPWNGPFTYLYFVFYPLVNLSMTGSVWTILAISVERFIAISQPFTHWVRNKKKISKIISVIVFCGSIIINLPTLFELNIAPCVMATTNQMRPQIGVSQLRRNTVYQLVYRVLCYVIFLGPVPFLVILVVTIRTLCIRHNLLFTTALRRRSSGNGAIQCFPAMPDRTATLLTVMILKFLVCYTGPTIINVLELVSDWPNQQWFSDVIDVSNLLVVIHSATNWLIFRHWTPKEELSAAIHSSARKSYHGAHAIFTNNEIACLHGLWEKCKQRQKPDYLGYELLKTILEGNPKLLRHYAIETSSSVETGLNHKFSLPCYATDSHGAIVMQPPRSYFPIIPEIKEHGKVIGNLIDEMFHNITDGKKKEEITERLESIGKIHFNSSINLRKADWFQAKNFLVGSLINEMHNPNDLEVVVAKKFVNYIFGGIKRGFISGAQITPPPPVHKTFYTNGEKQTEEHHYLTRETEITLHDFETINENIIAHV